MVTSCVSAGVSTGEVSGATVPVPDAVELGESV